MSRLRIIWRRTCVVAVHLGLAALANALAFSLRFDGPVPAWAIALGLGLLPLLLALRGVVFLAFGLYRGVWRYTGIWELRNIVGGVAASSALFGAIVAFVAPNYPRSVVVIDALVVMFLIGGARLAFRLRRGTLLMPGRRSRSDKTRKLLIYGAGEAGESIVRDIHHDTLTEYTPVGFIDDNPMKLGRTIHGVPVLGTRGQLRRVMAEHDPDEVLIAMPAADASTVRRIVRSLEPFNVRINILPNLRDILNGTVTISQIRRLAVEDLLPRVPVGLNDAPLRHLLSGRRVMVTGAGGSIGSELCQQIAALGPESLILYERNENGLYAVTNALADRGAIGVYPTLGDITDVDRLERVLASLRPEIIFHAAAHKHVPMMEAHPCEAIKNNVGGTRVLAEAAKRHGVARFILISTDKAVNPTSIMGASKRIAELVVMNEARTGGTTFMAVRFGNVLGSNGSAIPRFIDQIRQGGPVTITHPEMRRYFMLLPEAVQLVLHVAGRGTSKGVYVLDMGEQLKVEEMARNVIRMSGYVPDEDIAISYIGLRPGEKLFEELVGAAETVQPSCIEKVFEVRSRDLPSPDWLASQVRQLERVAKRGDASAVIRGISTIVPEFTGRPWEPLPAEAELELPAPLRVLAAPAASLGT
jgi:FlaA1/EpsC-like NDP-sugar epimerase